MVTTERSGVYRYDPDYAIPPGETLAETLDTLGMTQAELARRTGLSTKHVNQIINGAAPISPETALMIEKVTKVPARLWNGLEVAYREFLSRQEEDAALESDVGWLADIPVKELIKRGYLGKGSSAVDQLRKVCEFFGVASRAAWEAVWHKPTAYRKSKAFTSDPGAVAAWLRIGELQAAEIECEPFDRAGLPAALQDIRGLTLEQDPGRWWPRLRNICSDVGVAVVAEPEIRGSRINGAARWLSPHKALIQLSLRHSWNDIIWFTFFHEAGHLLLHSKKETFINGREKHSGVEDEADAFAAQTVIPRRYEAELSQLRTLDDATRFAARLGIAPGIVVGRLQHDGRWSYTFGNGLKQRLKFTQALESEAEPK